MPVGCGSGAFGGVTGRALTGETPSLALQCGRFYDSLTSFRKALAELWKSLNRLGLFAFMGVSNVF